MPLPADAPRRSSRRSKPKNYSTYTVGDVVEITRHNVSAAGRLVYKLSEGPTPNPRWLVTFDAHSWKDEELYERSFGKILEKAEGSPVPKSTNTRRGKGSSSPKNGRKNSGPSSSEDDDQSGSKRKKKKVAFSEDSVAGSDESPSPSTGGDDATKAKVSAREQRSRRRQAKMHEEAGEVLSPEDRKRGRVGSTNSTNSSTNAPKKRSRKNEEVVKIPMLTGTLYLYRGLERRAEFVRKF